MNTNFQLWILEDFAFSRFRQWRICFKEGEGGSFSIQKNMSQKRCFFVYLGSYGDGKRWTALGLGQNGILVP